MRTLATRLRQIHPHWATTILLDLVLMAVLTLWYVTVTSYAPLHPDPSTHQIFQVPIVAGYAGRTHCIRTCASTMIFGSRYVGPVCFGAFCLWAGNCVLLILGALWSFFKEL